ncbi:MAG: hypothetical protein K0S07_195 [Chlamydiales bacterium]|jgi:hypothetical protein|nr:hypothetical protein [Chlamydiales bacterium]
MRLLQFFQNDRWGKIWRAALYSTSLALPLAASEIRAVTEDAVRVILYPDGRWAYEQHVLAFKDLQRVQEKAVGKQLIRGRKGAYGFWVNPQIWHASSQPFTDDADLSFYHKSRKVFALTIYEYAEMSLEQVEEAVLKNMRTIDPKASLTHQGKILVNEREVLTLQVEALVDKTPFTYLGYFCSGRKGTFQVITYADQGTFHTFEADILDLLSGLVLF